MRFHEAANFLFDLRRFDPRPGTEATAELLATLGDPHADLACVQVAGSNGKGSTARLLESVLRETGLDVGLYTSPHLDDVRERIRVDGRPLPERSLVRFVEATRTYITGRASTGDAPTFFETLTALALWEFGRQDVDVAILEVGIGGTHDATSVVDPVASAVTTVALEHTDLLGEDIPTIARDKAGVAPVDRPLVSATTGLARETIRETVADLLPVTLVDGGPGTGDGPGSAGEQTGIQVTYRGRDGIESRVDLVGADWQVETNLSLLGEHQALNAGVAAALARQVGDTLGVAVDTDTLARGLRGAHWPGRFEILDRDPLVVLDGAHNPDGCARVAETLAGFETADCHLVVGALTDKDHREMAAALDGVDTVVACEPDHPRAESDDVLARAFAAEADADISTRSDVAGAVADTLDRAGPEDCVLVTGSLYTVAEARSRWTRAHIETRVDSIPAAERVLETAHVTDAGTWRMRGKAVHRVLQTRVQRRQAQYLKEELLSLGGECAVSGVEDPTENVDVVLMGTLAQFRRLCDKLDDQPFGLAPLADDIRAALDIGRTPERTRAYPWSDGPVVMGIVNVTPDSFHDGGEFDTVEAAVARAREQAAAGAAIVDIGGESTRPGADPVSATAERDRVVPVVEELADLDAMVSVDTRKAGVARAALEAGADMLNDVSGLADPAMRHVAAEYDVPIVVMHSLDTPVDPDRSVAYDDVVGDVLDELTERVLLAESAGLDRAQIVVDPGLGFGKSATESFALLDRLDELQALGCPVLVGHSQKSMFEAAGLGPDERTSATVAGTALATERGADIVRVHDVAENVAAVDVVEAAREKRDS